MKEPTPTERTTQSGAPRFRPVAVLSMLYFAVFFFAFGLLLVVPELNEILETMPTGPNQQAAAEEAVQSVFRPRLPIAFVAALGTTALGVHFQLLPGLRS